MNLDQNESVRLVANLFVKLFKDSAPQSSQALKHLLNHLPNHLGSYVSMILFSLDFHPFDRNDKTDIFFGILITLKSLRNFLIIFFYFLDLIFSSDFYSLISYLLCFVPKIDFKTNHQQKRNSKK